MSWIRIPECRVFEVDPREFWEFFIPYSDRAGSVRCKEGERFSSVRDIRSMTLYWPAEYGPIVREHIPQVYLIEAEEDAIPFARNEIL